MEFLAKRIECGKSSGLNEDAPKPTELKRAGEEDKITLRMNFKPKAGPSQLAPKPSIFSISRKRKANTK